MKTLRSRLFLFISLLLLLPAIPLSIFINRLLDKSYSIGVNPNVEQALDGALKISAEYYQLHREKLKKVLENISDQVVRTQFNFEELQIELTGAEYEQIKIPLISKETLVNFKAIEKFLNSESDYIIWPTPDHNILFALAKISKDKIIQIKYSLPENFSLNAANIQAVNQMYKTLGAARESIGQSFLFAFLVVYGFGLILALAVSYYISKRITKPIELLKTATTEFGRGNLKYRIPYKGHDEFKILSDALGNMASEIEQNQEQIFELEKMATWQQLARRLAHEIKNPLTPIQLMAQQIRDSYRGQDKEYQKMLDESAQIIEDEVGSLKKLVREFSDFARMPEFNPAKQDMHELFLAIAKLYQDSVKLVIPDSLPELNVDYDYLKRALINLVDNAIAASDGIGEVLLRIELQKEQLNILIEDRGHGIAHENIQKIFEPYFSTKSSGVGLGLSIVKKIVEEHNGLISVDSQPEQGTTFKIILPIIS